ncbi:histidine kinase [Microbacterium ulmi]|uniref:Histidine kinase n=1 Tax=Microbacterium ulmi TaxID=179095 RepID=A0A7Y2Q220_9MICO|nr:histidine kinase [Microbacterium ulmi]NII70422.1 hypothetical protein [Microbacterium ulmi]NNH04977.1 histidine kinase [Microbacterium ulmi]
MTTNTPSRVAAILLWLEGCAVLALAVWQVFAAAGGDAGSFTSAIALIVLTVVAGVAVLAFGVGVWRAQSWGRSGGIVTQALILAVALGAATGAYAHPLTGLALAVPAAAAFVALVMSARRAGADARADASGEPPAAER